MINITNDIKVFVVKLYSIIYMFENVIVMSFRDKQSTLRWIISSFRSEMKRSFVSWSEDSIAYLVGRFKAP